MTEDSAPVHERMAVVETEITNLKESVTLLDTDMKTLLEDTAIIIRVIGGASKAGRFVRVNGPRVVAAFIGWLIATGKFDENFIRFLQQVFMIA